MREISAFEAKDKLGTSLNWVENGEEVLSAVLVPPLGDSRSKSWSMRIVRDDRGRWFNRVSLLRMAVRRERRKSAEHAEEGTDKFACVWRSC